MRLAKPIAEHKEGRNLRRERRRWDDPDSHILPLGCVQCADREPCGGIHKKQLDYYCLGDCCGNPSTCDNVCPRNFETYVERYREVDGFDLDNIPRATPLFRVPFCRNSKHDLLPQRSDPWYGPLQLSWGLRP